MQIKKMISFLIFSSIYFSLSAQGHHHGHHHNEGKHAHYQNMVGQTFLVHYTDNSDKDYKLTFVTDSTVKWMDAKATEGNIYSLNKINRTVYLGWWDGRKEGSIQQVIDLHHNKMYTTRINENKKMVSSTATLTAQVVETTTPATPATQPATTTPAKK